MLTPPAAGQTLEGAVPGRQGIGACVGCWLRCKLENQREEVLPVFSLSTVTLPTRCVHCKPLSLCLSTIIPLSQSFTSSNQYR